MKLPWWVPFAIALLAAAAIAAWQGAERERGALEADLALAEAQTDSALRIAEMAVKAFRRDTVVFHRVRRTTDTLTQTVEAWKRDTVRVVEYVTLADSTIRACSAALASCEQRIAAADAVTAGVTRQLEITRRLVGAPRTAIGVAWDATTGRVGVAADRDFGRLRAGAAVTPGGAGLRLSWWW